MIGTLDEQSKALQNIQGTLDSGFGSATKHRDENKEEVKEHVSEEIDKLRQEMFAKQAETERKRDREHQQLIDAVASGKKLNFESNDAPAAASDNHLGKDVVVADEETTTTTSSTEHSSNSTTLDSIDADGSLVPAKNEAINFNDVEVKVENEAASLEVKDANANTKSTANSSLPAASTNEAINFKDTVEVKVEKESLAPAPRTPAPRNFTLRDTCPTSTAKKDQFPPLSTNKRRFAATPHSRTRLCEAETEHIERRKRGRNKETANSDAKTMNVKHEQIFQTRRQTRSASKKQPPSGSR